MCVWCAYTGKREAAPLVTEWGRRIEGLWSGYYSGVVSQDNDGLHSAKTTGCQRFWDEKFRMEDYPGTTALWHSRTNSGGDEHFAHPFIGVKGMVGLVSQGSAGIFAPRRDAHTALMNRYLHEGMVFPSAVEPLGSKYNVLDNGKQIHCSDFVAQFVEWEYLRVGDALKAIRTVFTQYQEEASSIMVFKDQPGRIYFETTSQRILVARYADGVALAICALAFGPDHPQCMEIPVNSIGYVEGDGTVYLEKLSPIYETIDIQMPGNCLPAARRYLQEHGPSYLAHLCDGAITPLFPKDTNAHCTAIAAYRTLEELYFNDELELLTFEEKNPVNGIVGRFDKLKLK